MKKKKEKVDVLQAVFFRNIRSERAQEALDASMLSESKDSPANLPRKEINKTFYPNMLTQKLLDAC